MNRTACSFCLVLIAAVPLHAKTLTYNQCDTISLRDRGLAADERATHVLLADGDVVYGATSGDACHVFRFDPSTSQVTLLATIPGPNTIVRGMVLDGDAIYVGTMLSRKQLWLKARAAGQTWELEDANLIPVKDSYATGHLLRIGGIHTSAPTVEDLGVPVARQGIHTLALDPTRQLLYGVTAPGGRFFVYHIKTGTTEQTSFGMTYATVSNHMVAVVEVERELADLTPGEGEWNNRLIPRAMHVTEEGTLYTSGWQGRILKYDPNVAAIRDRFSTVGWIPSVPGRQYWNRVDAIVERDGKLYLGTSDGYIVRLDPEIGALENLGKPIRAIEVMGMAFSPIDGKLYGVSGGGLEGMSRFWACDVERGTFEVDYPALKVLPNRHRAGALVCTGAGTLVLSEAIRVADLVVLTPGEPKQWEKSGILNEFNPGEARGKRAPDGRFDGHKLLEVEVYPIPSKMHGGSGYTAIQADNDSRVYVGTAYYGHSAQLVQLDPKTALWRSIFRSDEFTHQYGRGQGIPGKIHTKLRLGADGKIYGAMKQGYELHYSIRADVGEAPEGRRGSQFTCHMFAYDPATDTTADLGPGWPQEGITAFDVDTDRHAVYCATVPGVFFLVHDTTTRRTWNAGSIRYAHPTRYMPLDPGTGKVYHPGEVTPAGKHFMTVWEPEAFRLRDIEVVAEEGFEYRHSYATCCGPAGSQKLYGRSGDYLFEMDLDASKEGKLRVRPICTVGVEGDPEHSGLYAMQRGPDGRIYWASSGGSNVPIDLFAWDPKTETKTYLGACALAGQALRGGSCQGLCLDPQGNLALHILYAEIPHQQRAQWKVAEDFFYQDITARDHFVGFPAHRKGTYYAVYYVKNVVAMR